MERPFFGKKQKSQLNTSFASLLLDFAIFGNIFSFKPNMLS
jgi:hypothetical protein